MKLKKIEKRLLRINIMLKEMEKNKTNSKVLFANTAELHNLVASLEVELAKNDIMKDITQTLYDHTLKLS